MDRLSTCLHGRTDVWSLFHVCEVYSKPGRLLGMAQTIRLTILIPLYASDINTSFIELCAHCARGRLLILLSRSGKQQAICDWRSFRFSLRTSPSRVHIVLASDSRSCFPGQGSSRLWAIGLEELGFVPGDLPKLCAHRACW